jgi:hypothetical protein
MMEKELNKAESPVTAVNITAEAEILKSIAMENFIEFF